MDFLNKIKRIITRKPKQETFEEQVRREKKQKYLFHDDTHDMFVPKRGKAIQFLKKKHSKKQISHKPFSSFFQKTLYEMGQNQDSRYIMGIIGAFLLVLSGYVIIFSPYFKISPNRILVEPKTQGIDLSIAYRSLEGIYGKNILTLEEKKIAHKLKENLRNIKHIEIDRLFPNGVKILIESYPILFSSTIYGVENKKFWLSTNGVLIPASDLKDAQFQHYIEIISQELKSEIFLGYKKIISDQNMFLINKILELFSIEWSDLKIAKVRYFSLENELHIILESNTKILFALQDESGSPYGKVPDFLLKELHTFKTYLTSNHSALIDGSLEYVDMRIPGKVFFCRTSDQCKKNLNLVYGNTYE